MNTKLERTVYIPKESAHEQIGDVDIYRYERAGVPYAMAFAGKAQKPTLNYRFRSIEAREASLADFVENRAKSLQFRAEQRAAYNAKPMLLAVGDVLRSSWGYDQTNIDFYEVTKIIGTKMVEIRPIAQESKETAWAQGECIPVPGHYIGEPMRKKAQGDGVRINSFSGASKVQPTVIAGAKVYNSSHWTAYA